MACLSFVSLQRAGTTFQFPAGRSSVLGWIRHSIHVKRMSGLGDGASRFGHQEAHNSSHCSSLEPCCLGQAASASPGNFLELTILRPTPYLLDQKLQAWGLAFCVLTSPPRWFWCARVWEPLAKGFGPFILPSYYPRILYFKNLYLSFIAVCYPIIFGSW